MRLSLAVLLVFALCAAVSGQFVQRFVIDDFGVGEGDGIVITLDAVVEEEGPDQQEVASFDYPGCTNLVGCARDMELRVIKGLNGRSFSSQILSPDVPEFAGNWVVANPKTSIGFVSLEYDGPDSEFDDLVDPDFTLSLDGTGAAGVDITDGGLSRELRFIVITDLLTTFTVVMYDTNGGECTYSVEITPVGNDYTEEETLYTISLDSANPNTCDRTNVGYIQLFVTNDDAVDLIVRRIEIIGVPDPSQSRTPTPTRSISRSNTPTRSISRTPTGTPSNSPTRTPTRSVSRTRTPTRSISRTPTGTPSNSRTPTPTRSVSRTPSPTRSVSRTPTQTPSRTPSPSGPCIIFCDCPSFTCQIVYDLDDNINNVYDYDYINRFVDDDDGITFYYINVPVDDNNNPDDDQIIYVDDNNNPNDDQIIYVDDNNNPDDDQIIYVDNGNGDTRIVYVDYDDDENDDDFAVDDGQSIFTQFTSGTVSFTGTFTNSFTATFGGDDDDDNNSSNNDDDDNNSSNNDDDDDSSNSSNNDDDDDNNSSNNDDDDDNNGSSSSSSATVIAASVALIAVALF